MFPVSTNPTPPRASWAPRHHRWRGPSIVAEHRETYDPGSDDRARQTNDPADNTLWNGRLDAVRDGLTDIADTLKALGVQIPDRHDARSLDLAELDACIAALKRLEGATAAIKSRLVACAAGARAHDAAGMSGTDAYLRNRLGISAREAKKQAELARSLDGMDDTTDACRPPWPAGLTRRGPEQAAG